MPQARSLALQCSYMDCRYGLVIDSTSKTFYEKRYISWQSKSSCSMLFVTESKINQITNYRLTLLFYSLQTKKWDISSAGHVEKGKSILETAQCELAEELGITANAGELQYAFTIPAEQTPLGGCNAFEHVYFLHGNSETKMSLGMEEVSGVSWISASKLLAALQNGDDNYAPRTKQYCEAMGSFLKKMLSGID